MKKGILIAIAAIVLLIVLILVVRMQNRNNAPYERIEFNATDYVTDWTKMGYMDTLVQAGLISMGIDSVAVLVRPIVKESMDDKNGEIDLLAYIKGNRNQFSLYITKLNHHDAIDVISHELIHLDQYRSGRLVSMGDTVVWNGDTIIVKEIPYDERGWEVEARRKSPELAAKIEKMLVR